MSLEYIRQISDEIAIDAAIEGRIPYVPWNAAELESWPPFPFPEFGSYVPTGWNLAVILFCDSSGFGSEYEPALTADQLLDVLHDLQLTGISCGYGIIDVGQFQLEVGVWVRDDRWDDSTRDQLEILLNGRKSVYLQF